MFPSVSSEQAVLCAPICWSSKEGTLGSSVITRFVHWFKLDPPNIFPSFASAGGYLLNSTNYMYLKLVLCFFIPTAFTILESSSIKHSSLCARFRSCSTGAVLHFAVGVTSSPFLPTSPSLALSYAGFCSSTVFPPCHACYGTILANVICHIVFSTINSLSLNYIYMCKSMLCWNHLVPSASIYSVYNMQTSMLFAFFTMTNAIEAVFIHVDKKGLGVYYVLILITLI